MSVLYTRHLFLLEDINLKKEEFFECNVKYNNLINMDKNGLDLFNLCYNG